VTSVSRPQRVIGALYSWAAGRLYEPIVVQGAFRLLGGKLNDLVAEQCRRATDAARGQPILDIPVGTAFFALQTAAMHNGLLVGADYARGMSEQASRAARESGADSLVSVQADVHRLPFRTGSFAVVMCTNGLQVIPQTAGAVAELARVLAPRGVLLVSVLVASLGRLLPARYENHMPAVLRSGKSIAEELEAAGLVVTSFRRDRFAYLMEATTI
jgi:ubiquinone/menaquinone biosynthesis C-methylase UbiE